MVLGAHKRSRVAESLAGTRSPGPTRSRPPLIGADGRLAIAHRRRQTVDTPVTAVGNSYNQRLDRDSAPIGGDARWSDGPPGARYWSAGGPHRHPTPRAWEEARLTPYR